MKDDRPQWKINKSKRDAAYIKSHSKSMGVRIYEADFRYYEIWMSIPNKTEWLKQKLDEYAKENSLD